MQYHVMNDRDGRRYRVLLVKDEVVVAMLMEDILADLGCEVTATATRVEDALTAAKSGSFDFAILDVNLNGSLSYPIADILRQRNIPIIFATGYGTKDLDASYAGAPTLQKPFRPADLEAAVSRILSAGA